MVVVDVGGLVDGVVVPCPGGAVVVAPFGIAPTRITSGSIV
jgi:hypothetical protein